MDAQQTPPRASGTSVARRGVLAGVATLVAGVLARASERVASAANGDVLTAGNSFTETSTFSLTNTSTGSTCATFHCNGAGNGLEARCNGSGASYGVWGTSDQGTGVVGTSGPGVLTVPATGVWGNSALTSGVGVRCDALVSGGVGVRGNANKLGVLGVSTAQDALDLAAPNQAAGVYGLTNGSAVGVVGQSNTGVGVQGASSGNVGVLGTSTTSHALYGSSVNGYGVYATSTNNTGVVASTNGGNAIQGASNSNVGVLGTSNSSIGGFFASGTATGLYATGPAAGFAARFDGRVQVNGPFTVLGGPKSAAVPHPDGSHRRLYCVESPESWFEDFGRDQLVNGRARVRLDPDFDALVHGDDYLVFLTEHGDQGGLYVETVGPHAFTVRARNGTANSPFSYRVVAKRKDIAGPRLERVDVPGAPPRPAAPVVPPAITPLDPPRVAPNAPAVERKSR